MLTMNLSDYIRSVCEANRLRDTAVWMSETGEAAYHADRHVESPPEGLGPQAACSAGLALLVEWTKDASVLESLGLTASKPMLIVHQEWLDEHPDASPPHVLVTLCKTGGALPPAQLNASPTSRDKCPIGYLLTGELGEATVFRLEPSLERESLGGWLFQLDAPETPDS